MKDYFKADVGRIKSDVQKCIIDIAKDAFNEVVDGSPDPTGSKGGYSLGSYVLSHRVSTSGIEDKSFTTVVGDDPAAAGKAKAYGRGAITRALVVIGTDVVISNNIDYADDVEFIGWKMVAPYYTYGAAHSLASLRAQARAAAV